MGMARIVAKLPLSSPRHTSQRYLAPERKPQREAHDNSMQEPLSLLSGILIGQKVTATKYSVPPRQTTTPAKTLQKTPRAAGIIDNSFPKGRAGRAEIALFFSLCWFFSSPEFLNLLTLLRRTWSVGEAFWVGGRFGFGPTSWAAG